MQIYGFHIAVFVSIVCLSVASTVPLAVQPSFDLQVTGAWIRWLPANFPGAGYMTLTNRGSTAPELIRFRAMIV